MRCLALAMHAPHQVDGEPCLLDASIIEIGHKNRATMLCTRKGRFSKMPYMPPIASMLREAGHDQDGVLLTEHDHADESDDDVPHDGILGLGLILTIPTAFTSAMPPAHRTLCDMVSFVAVSVES